MLQCSLFRTLLALLMTGMALAQYSPQDIALQNATQHYKLALDSQDYYEQSSAYYTAEKELSRFIRNYPYNEHRPEATYMLGVCQLNTDQVDLARENFSYVKSVFPSTPAAGASAYKLAELQLQDENYQKAQKLFHHAYLYTTKPQLKSHAKLQEAICWQKLENYQKAHKILKTFQPSDLDLYLESQFILADVELARGKYQQAQDIYESLLASTEVELLTKQRARINLLRCYTQLGQTERAKTSSLAILSTAGIPAELKSVAQLELYKIYTAEENDTALLDNYQLGIFSGSAEDTAQANLLAGYAFLRKGMFNRAIDTFSRAERLMPATKIGMEASYRRLHCFYQLEGKDIPEMASLFYDAYQDQALDSKAWLIGAKVLQAEHLYASGDLSLASEVYRSINSDSLPLSLRPAFLYKKVSCMMENKEYDRVTRSAGTFLSDHSSHALAAEVTYQRGVALLAQNNLSSAIKDFQSIIDHNRESELSALALQGLIKAYSKNYNYDQLLLSTQLLLNKFPGLNRNSKAFANYWQGWAYFKKENYTKAIPCFEEARTLAPNVYKEPSGTRIVLAAYYQQNASLLNQAYQRIQRDVPGKYFPPRILAWLGISLYQQEEYKSARRVLHGLSTPQALDQTPLEVWRHLNKANVKLGQSKAALSFTQYVIDQSESPLLKVDAYLDHIEALTALKQYQNVITNAQSALALEPSGLQEANIRLLLAQALEQEKRQAEAQNEYLLVASKLSGDSELRPLALYRAGTIMQQLNPEEAQAILNNLKSEYPNWVAPTE